MLDIYKKEYNISNILSYFMNTNIISINSHYLKLNNYIYIVLS